MCYRNKNKSKLASAVEEDTPPPQGLPPLFLLTYFFPLISQSRNFSPQGFILLNVFWHFIKSIF